MHAAFCWSCGRIISRTAKQSPAAEASVDVLQKYCSKSCRAGKPTDLDGSIESLFVQYLLQGHVDRKTGVLCTLIQSELFGAQEGMQGARERERVRRAGRRIVVFPHKLDETPLKGKLLECVQNGKPVEGSFAKGDWGVRIVE